MNEYDTVILIIAPQYFSSQWNSNEPITIIAYLIQYCKKSLISPSAYYNLSNDYRKPDERKSALTREI